MSSNRRRRSGIETTLKIYVNGILWHEAESLFNHGPDERIYITRLQDDGKTVITFGDGTSGLTPARPVPKM